MDRLSTLYASALFDLTVRRGMIDESLAQASFLRDVLQDGDALRVLLHPHIPRAEKSKFLTDSLKGQVHDDLLGLLYLAVDKNREKHILPALVAFISLIEKRKKIVTAKVISASELDSTQAANLEKALSAKLNKKVRLSVKVDSSMVAGPYIFADGYYLDWTVKKRLSDLTVHMKEGCTA